MTTCGQGNGRRCSMESLSGGAAVARGRVSESGELHLAERIKPTAVKGSYAVNRVLMCDALFNRMKKPTYGWMPNALQRRWINGATAERR